ncbi:MAG: YceI family protein [Acidimicrobiia bacterium]|nr:YceI family protein [Acidimicrobiia bacterium]
MNRWTIAVAAAVVVIGGGAAWWFSQGTEAPSTDVTAPPVETSTTAATTPASTSTTEASAPVTYSLTDDSIASFTITEELRGTPTTVVGVSDIVLGEVLFDPSDPSSLQIGTILVNARAFETDSSNRNRAIRGPILDADTFEFIEFVPTSIDEGTEGEFTVTGDLTIRDQTNPVTFEVVAEIDGEIVRGTATATVDRTLWGLNIPSAPGVANVSEMVTLTLDFVAAPTS